MAKQLKTVDGEGVEIGSTRSANNTVEKTFFLSSRATTWPRDKEGKPVSLRFSVIIDMKDVTPDEILDDAIRTKVITLQNALRGTGENVTPFEVLKTMSAEPLRRHYNTCGATPENPEKAAKSVMAAFSNLSPEMKAMLLKQMAEQAK